MTNRPMKQSGNSLDCRDLRTVAFLLAFGFVSMAAVGSAIQAEPQPLRTERHATRIPIHDFKLIDQNGAPFEFKNVAGRVLVVGFAYTTCVDVCPLLTAAMRQVQNGLGQEEHERVQLITITTDPEIDSPKVLSAYGYRYGADFANWAFLTGNPSALKNIWKNFGVVVKRKGRGLVDHTPLTAIVDKKGVMRVGYVGGGLDPNAVLADVRVLLRQN